MKRYTFSFLLIFIFIIMLIRPSDVFLGAQTGLLLWFNIVLPTLFPFMIISSLIINTSTLSYISKFTGPLFHRFLGISYSGSFAVLGGFLCGYPMGAKITADLITTHKITREEGAYLLSFCNNTSPMFLISYILWQQVKDDTLILPSVLIFFGAPLVCSKLFYMFHYKKLLKHSVNPTFSSQKNVDFHFSLLDRCIMKSMESIVSVGGYIIVFSIIISLIQSTDFLGGTLKLLCLSSLEITNGITLICNSSFSPDFRGLLSLSLASFGGLCATAQTSCMVQDCQLSIKTYLIEKLVTTIVTSLCAYTYLIMFR